MPSTDTKSSNYADISSQLLFRAYHDKDTNKKKMANLSQELG